MAIYLNHRNKKKQAGRWIALCISVMTVFCTACGDISTGSIPEDLLDSGTDSSSTSSSASDSDTPPNSEDNILSISSVSPNDSTSANPDSGALVALEENAEPTGGEPEEKESSSSHSSGAANTGGGSIGSGYLRLIREGAVLPEDYQKNLELKQVYVGGDGVTTYKMEAQAADALLKMIADALKDNIDLGVASAYRSFEYQEQNFNRSVQQREAEGMSHEEAYAETLRNVQLPYQSEHCSGLAADIFSGEYWSFKDDGFKKTRAYKWLTEHAADYGYILRYPEGKDDVTGIIFEPWHWRYVGVENAKAIKESGKLTLEEYLGWNGSR